MTQIANKAATQTILINPARRNLCFLAFAIGSFAIGTAEFAAMALLPEVQEFMHINETQAGYFVSFYALGVVIGAPLLAVLTARVPRKILLVCFMLFYALANLLSVLAAVNPYLYGFFRFLSGLPHGIYFGVACIVAASMVEPARRPGAIGSVMLGLTVATIFGVMLVTWIGQQAWIGEHANWLLAFVLVSAIAVLAAGLIAVFMPAVPRPEKAGPLAELRGLKNGQLWLLLMVIAVGMASTFAVYTYIREILFTVSHAPDSWAPIILPLFGCGMVAGNLIGPRIALHFGLMPSIFITLLWSLLTFIIFYMLMGAPASAAIAVFLVGTNFMSQPSIQTRIMDVSPGARTLATALMQSFYNIANAFGAYAGGAVIARGFGLPSTVWVGALFALLGLLIFIWSWYLARGSRAGAPDRF
ncbi:MAG: MFS transporter [Candidatus Tokpelaia sp.]|nr:MAG: MFS transporter [Candidatus Tokpelaia sp.]KAA6206970.1 MAG: MFS transporter [Candidatus Tokpelaia sp.]